MRAPNFRYSRDCVFSTVFAAIPSARAVCRTVLPPAMSRRMSSSRDVSSGSPADGAWSACQALHTLGRAEPDEERFYDRLRNAEPLAAADRLALSDWSAELLTLQEEQRRQAGTRRR